MKYNKLVRDKIPEIIKRKGEEYKIRIADDKEYWQKLKEKLLEEVEEFHQGESIEEIVDILELLEAIADYKKFSKEDIDKAKHKKAEEKGKFKNRIILEES